MSDAGRARAAAFFSAYAHAFSTFDAAAITRHWSIPAVISSGGDNLRLATTEAFEENVRKLCERYRERHMSRAAATLVAWHEITQQCWLARVHYQLFKADARLTDWVHGYLLRAVQGELRIEMAVADDEMRAWAKLGYA